MVKKLRIGFCLPFGIILEHTPAWISYKNLEKIKEWEISHKIAYGSGVGENRNICARDQDIDLKYQEINSYDKLLLVDYDVSYTTKDVEHIINSDKKVISGLYQLKNDFRVFNKCHAGLWEDEKGLINHRYNWNDSGIKKCNWLGSGFLCIEKTVFEKLPYPWFIHKLIEIVKENNILRKETGEDIGFSLLCEEYGIELFVDCDVKVKHNLFCSKENSYKKVIEALEIKNEILMEKLNK